MFQLQESFTYACVCVTIGKLAADIHVYNVGLFCEMETQVYFPCPTDFSQSN